MTDDKNAELLRELRAIQPKYDPRFGKWVTLADSMLAEIIAALATAPQDATSNARRRVSEIEDAIACGSMSAAQVFTQMRQLIPSAPQPQQQDDCVRVAVKMPEEFAQWFESQVPPGTVISNPRWWAPKIYRALLAAAKEPVAKPKPDPLSQALNEGDGVYRP